MWSGKDAGKNTGKNYGRHGIQVQVHEKHDGNPTAGRHIWSVLCTFALRDIRIYEGSIIRITYVRRYGLDYKYSMDISVMLVNATCEAYRFI